MTGSVQSLVTWLLTDEELRHEFLVGPSNGVQALQRRGVVLSDADRSAICSTNWSLWIKLAEPLEPRFRRDA